MHRACDLRNSLAGLSLSSAIVLQCTLEDLGKIWRNVPRYGRITMLDVGWSELMMMGLVALIIIGPKDLPRVMRTIGKYVGKVQGMAREFQSSMDDMAREAELDEAKKKLQKATNFDLKNEIRDSIDPTRSVEKEFDTSVFDDDVNDAADASKVASPSTSSDTQSADPASKQTDAPAATSAEPKKAAPKKAAPKKTAASKTAENQSEPAPKARAAKTAPAKQTAAKSTAKSAGKAAGKPKATASKPRLRKPSPKAQNENTETAAE